jgi:hypothetical protein
LNEKNSSNFDFAIAEVGSNDLEKLNLVKLVHDSLVLGSSKLVCNPSAKKGFLARDLKRLRLK